VTKKLPPLKSARKPAAESPAATLDEIKDTAPPAEAPEPPQAEAPEPPQAAPSSANPERHAKALSLLSRYRAFALAGGAVPSPGLDVVAVTGVQLRLLQQLAKMYEVPFDKVLAKSLVSALIGGAVPQAVALGVAGAAAKAVPGIGTVVGMGASMASATFATDIIGKMFIRHFESGGTLLDFDPRKAAK
jgi:uncharacterized protein (DUF697 family)